MKFTILEKLRIDRHLLILMFLFVFTIPLSSGYLRGDGMGYYAYVRSLVIDQDLNFTNEFRHGDPAFIDNFFVNGKIKSDLITPTGYVTNYWSVGPSLLWSPFFILTHGVVSLLNKFGYAIAADGYSAPYLIACAWGSAFYGFFGLIFCYLFLKEYFIPKIALISVIGIWLASSVPVYLYFLPFMSHAHSLFTVSLFIWYWQRIKDNKSWLPWILLGLIGGLMAMVYYINIIFIFLPVFWLFHAWGQTKEASIKTLFLLFIFFASLAVGLLPHLVIKTIINGVPYEIYYETQLTNLFAPQIFQVLFSARAGLFSWTPILLFSVAGLFVAPKKERWMANVFLACFIIFLYLRGSYSAWHGVSSFGNRFFVSYSIIFAFGLACLINYLMSRFSVKQMAINTVVLLFCVWNMLFIYQWGTKMVPNREPISWPTMIRNQFVVVPSSIFSNMNKYFNNRGSFIKNVEKKDLNEYKHYNRGKQ